MIAVERSFAVDHPTAAGHFPGHPIIPGAVLLDQVIRVLQEALQAELPTLEIRAAKFLHPVRPGDTMQILIDDPFGNRLHVPMQSTADHRGERDDPAPGAKAPAAVAGPRLDGAAGAQQRARPALHRVGGLDAGPAARRGCCCIRSAPTSCCSRPRRVRRRRSTWPAYPAAGRPWRICSATTIPSPPPSSTASSSSTAATTCSICACRAKRSWPTCWRGGRAASCSAPTSAASRRCGRWDAGSRACGSAW
ncbi:MAG: hypothetical protein MZW92_37905 [Comamonadaceae bacterium]|nr:hypothetical protein [Comamonadaceae bacterium]